MDEFDDDALLVAFIDGELDAQATSKLQARLLADAELRARLDLLKSGTPAFAPAFATLLNNAPTDRLQASLHRLLAADAARLVASRSQKIWLGSARVAMAACLLLVGIGLGWFAPIWIGISPQNVALSPVQHEDWRRAVAEYAALYTPDTFSAKSADAGTQAADMARLGNMLGVALTPEQVAISNLQYRGMQIFRYEGAVLGQIAYVDAQGAPVLFCIIANAEPDAALWQEKRGDLASASWALDGHGYMVIGRVPARQVAELASTLMQRF